MALVSVDSMKRRLKIEPTDTSRDELLGELVTGCIAQVETYLGRVILDNPLAPRTFGNVRAEYPRVRGLRVSDLAINTRFQESSESDDDYDRVTNLADVTALLGPLPLSTLPDYPRLEAVCNQAIAAWVADLYFRPNSMELTSREGGVMVSYGRTSHAGMPDQVVRLLKPIKDLSTV